MIFIPSLVGTSPVSMLYIQSSVSDFVKKEELADPEEEPILEDDEIVNSTKRINTEAVISADVFSNNTTKLVEGIKGATVDNFKETSEAAGELTLSQSSKFKTTKISKYNESRTIMKTVETTLKPELKVGDKSGEDCLLMKWLFVCRDFRVLKDKYIFAD